jgi:uncharacterized protein with FMN-binding domain
MTRILLAVVGTVLGLFALLSFKTHPITAGSTLGLPSASLPSASSAATPAAGSDSSSSAPPNPATSRSAAPKAAGSSSSAPTSTAQRTIAGQQVQTRYGIVQVQVVVSGSTIKNVSFLQLTADDPRSQEINDQAGPILLQETLSAQSSSIDTVSGATYTSQGYLQSLQSALDQAGIK